MTQQNTKIIWRNANPVGTVIYHAGKRPPQGYLICDGSEVSREIYKDLFNAIETDYGPGDGSATFNLPDLRGEFLRGADLGRGVDVDREVGSVQGDAIRNITGEAQIDIQTENGFGYANIITCYNSIGAIMPSSKGDVPYFTPNGITNTGNIPTAFAFDASQVVPTASENRPRNVAMLACIKY